MDLRYLGMGRPTMRDPKHPAWPSEGERTRLREVAERWRWAYADLADERHLERTLGRSRPKTLGPSIEAYLEHRGRVVEPRTLAGDRTVMRWLTDTFRATDALHGLPVQKLVDRLLDDGYKASTVGQYVTSIRSLYRWADLPMPPVDIPDPGTQDVRYWTDREVAKLRKAAPAIDPRCLIALDAALYMGLRVGEIFGLRWTDIDSGAATVRVQRQIPQGRSTPKPLKGKRSRTALVLPGWTHEGSEGYVVHEQGRPIGRRVQWRWMQELLDATGLNAQGSGWHMGRHTYSRMCLESGVTLEHLRQFLGHGSIRTTEDSYGHLRPSVAIEQARAKTRG